MERRSSRFGGLDSERFESRLDECLLWDAWYTGLTPVPVDLINPAPRLTIVAALLRPHEFSRVHADIEPDDRARQDLTDELSDTGVLLKGYLEAGRTINVYDWYQAFAGALDARRAQPHLRTTPSAPSTPARRSKEKNGATGANADMDMDEDQGEEEEEEALERVADDRWRLEVQARFVRALHELDYMGFVKHAARKADHVARTVFDVPPMS